MICPDCDIEMEIWDYKCVRTRGDGFNTEPEGYLTDIIWRCPGCRETYADNEEETIYYP